MTGAGVALIVGLYALFITVFYVLVCPGLFVRSLTLLAGRLTKEDTDIVDTRIATGTMTAFVFEEVEGFDVVKG